MIQSSGLIRNQNRISDTETINYGVDKIIIYCGFTRSYNLKYISDSGFELFEDIMLLTGVVLAPDENFIYVYNS